MTDDFTALSDTDRRGQYDAELRRAGEALCDGDHALYRDLLADVTALYKAQPQGYKRCINEVYRRAALRNGFEEYECWLAERIA